MIFYWPHRPKGTPPHDILTYIFYIICFDKSIFMVKKDYIFVYFICHSF